MINKEYDACSGHAWRKVSASLLIHVIPLYCNNTPDPLNCILPHTLCFAAHDVCACLLASTAHTAASLQLTVVLRPIVIAI